MDGRGEGEGARGAARPAVPGRRQGAPRGLARALQPQGVRYPAPRRRQLAPGPSSSSSSPLVAAVRFLTTATTASNGTDLSANLIEKRINLHLPSITGSLLCNVFVI